MPIEDKYKVKSSGLFKDVRPLNVRIADWFAAPDNVMTVYAILICLLVLPMLTPGVFRFQGLWDIDLLLGIGYMRWYRKRQFKLPFKMPKHAAPMPDPRNNDPGSGKKSEGILFLGNDRKTSDEVWISDSDARTHMLVLGTTGSGKTQALKALATNALTWGSGFVFVDGKADTSTWGEIYSLVRRFGREDDLLCINYMTGNSDAGSSSNSMNPFSSGSASYLVQMLVSLMPESGGENAMWKERAISLVGALMPALTYKRDNQHMLLDIGVVGEHIDLPAIIRLSRDQTLPQRITKPMHSYLKTLPGFVPEAFDDEGEEKPPSPDSPVHDLSVARQQHGYLSMQFTRALGSLSDDYGHIFKAQLADVDVLDVVLNRRILFVMIPALEKSGDEAANLGKIVVAALKGMMGSTLGAMVEGSWEMAIANKATNAPSPYMAIFDEVGYYTSPGMGVMAAQARSLGFSLVFAAQDLPAMEKRVKEEARSIAGNCNLKIFGKLEDPTGTREFFEKTVGSDSVMMVKSKQAKKNSYTGAYDDSDSVSIESKGRASYDALKEQRSGQWTMFFNEHVVETTMPYIDPGNSKALRIQKMLPVPVLTQMTQNREKAAADIAAKLKDDSWSAAQGQPAELSPLLAAAVSAFKGTEEAGKSPLEAGLAAVARMGQLDEKTLEPPPEARPAPKASAAMNGKAENGKAAQAAPKAPPAKPVVQPGQHRAPLAQGSHAAAPTPTEQDIARVRLPSTVPEELAPFALPEPAEPVDNQLRGIAALIGRKLFGDGDSSARAAGE